MDIDEKIKHYSFDFWNTIANSNPKFKENRNILISKLFNVSHVQINEAFITIGQKYNSQQEKNNIILTPEELLNKVIKHFETKQNIIPILEEINYLFKKYPPLLNINCNDLLLKMKNYNKTLSILSNTAFISGEILKQFLIKEYGDNTFSFFIFSDQVKMAKPSREVFKLCFFETKKHYGNTIKKNQIMHIGDNIVNDIEGAANFGFKTCLYTK